MNLTDAILLGTSRLAWGTTLEQVYATAGLELLPANPHAASDERDRSVRVAVPDVQGFATFACQLRAPARHKPVLDARYSLATNDATIASALTADFGEPEISHWESSRGQSGSILARALWRTPAFELNLSTYGAPRTDGPSAAPSPGFLSITWRDWDAAARPYLGAIAAVEDELQRGYDGLANRRARLGELQPARCEGNRARRAVTLDHLCDTPPSLAETLDEDEVALWRISPATPWLLSTRADTLQVQREGSVSLVSRPGTLTFTVDDLVLTSSSRTNELRVFAQQVAEDVGRQLEIYDMALWH